MRKHDDIRSYGEKSHFHSDAIAKLQNFNESFCHACSTKDPPRGHSSDVSHYYRRILILMMPAYVKDVFYPMSEHE